MNDCVTLAIARLTSKNQEVIVILGNSVFHEYHENIELFEHLYIFNYLELNSMNYIKTIYGKLTRAHPGGGG